ncbi:ABC transporter ATP-binding protein [Hydrogenimonas urashimensis]|uniref:ABC transporter ATP-binding protein n=1 Tax=Hydrogenimonas urashimensis TaxID=2740515 RepID=UPI001F416FAC|nr:ABC transporter ATP-binding protein [Hydrogenimonas urashimensis]
MLYNISFDFEPGGFYVVSGESGSGKSTLLSIVSTLLKPSEGVIYYNGVALEKIRNIDRFRNRNIGFVFQFHYLIGHLSVYENVAIATKKGRKEIMSLLDRLGIVDLASKYPDQISGGQRQRAAIARALINDPRYLFADEPTGNLDSKNSQKVFELLRQTDATRIVVTHDKSVIEPTDCLIELKDGRLC